jgi:hypothetical protein
MTDDTGPQANPDAERGYLQQLAQLDIDDTTVPRARYILELHQATLKDTPFNRGILRATADYIRAREPGAQPEPELPF